MNSNNRVLIFHEFKLEHSPQQAVLNICTTMGKGAVSERTCQRWYSKFKKGETSFEDKDQSGLPIEADIGKLKELIEEDPRLSTRVLAGMLNCSNEAIHRHLVQIGKVNRVGSWVPYELSMDVREQRVTICQYFFLCKKCWI